VATLILLPLGSQCVTALCDTLCSRAWT